MTVVPSTTMLPPVGREQAVEAAQQRRLAGAAAADDADELAGGNVEVDRLERLVAVGEDDPEVANLDAADRAGHTGRTLLGRSLRVARLTECQQERCQDQRTVSIR